MLSEKAITEFKKIWEEVNPYKEIEDQELLALANKVFRGIELLYDDDVNL